MVWGSNEVNDITNLNVKDVKGDTYFHTYIRSLFLHIGIEIHLILHNLHTKNKKTEAFLKWI